MSKFCDFQKEFSCICFEDGHDGGCGCHKRRDVCKAKLCLRCFEDFDDCERKRDCDCRRRKCCRRTHRFCQPREHCCD